MYKNRVIIILIFVIIMFFIFRYCTYIGACAMETVSSCILYPFLRAQHAVVEPVKTWLGRSASITELEEEMEKLQKKYDELCKENIALKSMHYYTNETKELYDFNKRYLLQKGKLAQVLARHLSSNNQFFLVDVGSSQGIKKEMVALYGNAIVGRVAEVYPWYCKICLITDADCKVAALCYKKNVSGIHEGVNDQLYTTMRYVSHLQSVDIADDVLSSGEGMIFPRGFALGKVVAADKGELFYTITIQPALNFQTLRYCTLIAKEHIE